VNSGYNELKLMVLMEMEAVEDAVAGEIAEKLEQTQASIGMAMLRYHRQGLLNRYTSDWKNEKVYSLTDKGRDRIDLLLDQEGDEDDDEWEDEDDSEEDEEDDDEEEENLS